MTQGSVDGSIGVWWSMAFGGWVGGWVWGDVQGRKAKPTLRGQMAIQTRRRNACTSLFLLLLLLLLLFLCSLTAHEDRVFGYVELDPIAHRVDLRTFGVEEVHEINALFSRGKEGRGEVAEVQTLYVWVGRWMVGWVGGWVGGWAYLEAREGAKGHQEGGHYFVVLDQRDLDCFLGAGDGQGGDVEEGGGVFKGLYFGGWVGGRLRVGRALVSFSSSSSSSSSFLFRYHTFFIKWVVTESGSWWVPVTRRAALMAREVRRPPLGAVPKDHLWC